MQSLARICLIAAVAAALVGCGGKEGAGETPKSSCSQVSAPSPNQALTRSKAPSGSAPATATWDVIVKTNCGSFGFSLEARTAPNAAAAFAQRVETGFYDGLAVHRIAPGFVIQGGGPTR